MNTKYIKTNDVIIGVIKKKIPLTDFLTKIKWEHSVSREFIEKLFSDIQTLPPHCSTLLIDQYRQ